MSATSSAIVHKKNINRKSKGPFTQAIFTAIFLLLMHAIKWIDLRMYKTICAI